MLTGPDVDPVLWNAAPPLSQSAVADLVAQLASGPGGDILMGDSGQAAAAVSNMYTNGDGFDAEKLKHLMAQLQQSNPLASFAAGGGLAPSQPQQGESAQGWNPGNQYSDYDRGYHETGTGRGSGDPNRRWNDDGPWAAGSGPGPGPGPGGPGGERGFRGRGRGGPRGMGRGRGDRNTKRKPCSFFLAGRRALEFAMHERIGRLIKLSLLLPSTDADMGISVTSATKHSRIDRCYDHWTTHLSAGWPPGIFLHPNRNLIRNTSSHLQAILLITRTFTICISS